MSDLCINICVKIISWFTELHASMASNKSDESEVEDQVNENEVDLGFPGTDLILVVEGRQIHVNKNVLSEHSAVFNLIPCLKVNSKRVYTYVLLDHIRREESRKCCEISEMFLSKHGRSHYR